MRKVFTTAYICLFALSGVFSQSDTVIVVSGTMYKAQDSTIVSANILYEKLPYYDDMGMASAREDGSFTMYLVQGETYNFSVTKPGFKKFEQQGKFDGNDEMNIYIEEDIVELRKLENLKFATNSREITSSSYQELDELAQWMNENPTIVIQLEGHTDFGGNAEASLRLSQARVESVKEYLIQKKVKKNRIFTRAFGGTQPLVTEGTPQERAKNRRVEVRVIRR